MIFAQSLLEYTGLSTLLSRADAIMDSMANWMQSQDPRVLIGGGVIALILVLLLIRKRH